MMDMKEKYETLPLTTLKELAKARGLKGISTMKKAQVIELMLQEDEKEQEKEKQEKLEAAMDRLRGKFGTDVISYGAARPEKEEDPLP